MPRHRGTSGSHGPDFLVISKHRSGTTWLYRALRDHPALWLPPVKSLRYFNHRETRPLLFELYRRPDLRRRMRRVVRQLLLHPGRADWFLRYMLLPRRDSWYLGLFQPADGQLAGEVCSAYNSLDDGQVAHVAALLPHVRLIYILRDPISLAWSHAAMFARRERIPPDNITELERLAVGPEIGRRTDYLRTLVAWQRHFADRQIFFGFFDELRRDSTAHFTAICRFLGVPPSGRAATIRHNPNPGSYPPMPPSVQRRLSELHYDQLIGLHDRFGNRHTARWLATAERALGATASPTGRGL